MGWKADSNPCSKPNDIGRRKQTMYGLGITRFLAKFVRWMSVVGFLLICIGTALNLDKPGIAGQFLGGILVLLALNAFSSGLLFLQEYLSGER